MKRIFILLCVITLISCQDKVICPAFQSTYILDDSTRNAYFSYVWQLDESTRSQFLAGQASEATASPDSTLVDSVERPQTDYYAYAGDIIVPWRVPARTKYGIVKPVFMPVKKYRMRTAPMENIFGPAPPSMDMVHMPLDSASNDSTIVSSGDTLDVLKPVATKPSKPEVKFLYGYDPSDNFNVEQLYYNKYFADKLLDTRPDPEPEPAVADTLGSDSVAVKEPFFKRIIKKKDKEEVVVEKEEESEENQLEEQPLEAKEEEKDEGDG